MPSTTPATTPTATVVVEPVAVPVATPNAAPVAEPITAPISAPNETLKAEPVEATAAVSTITAPAAKTNAALPETPVAGPVAAADSRRVHIEAPAATPVAATDNRRAFTEAPAKKPVAEPAEQPRAEGVVIPAAVPFVQDAPAVQPAPVTIEIDNAAASARTSELTKAVAEVAKTISITPALTRGDGEVVIHLKPEILDGSEIRLEAKGQTVTIDIRPANAEVAQVVERMQAQFAQQLTDRMPSFQFTVAVSPMKQISDRKSTNNETD